MIVKRDGYSKRRIKLEFVREYCMKPALLNSFAKSSTKHPNICAWRDLGKKIFTDEIGTAIPGKTALRFIIVNDTAIAVETNGAEGQPIEFGWTQIRQPLELLEAPLGLKDFIKIILHGSLTYSVVSF